MNNSSSKSSNSPPAHLRREAAQRGGAQFPGRLVSSVFRARPWRLRPRSQVMGILLIPPIIFTELLLHLPALLLLRRHIKKLKRQPRADISVAFFSDNLDEVNGIANNLRQVIAFLRSQGRSAYLVGTAFHTRPAGVVENSFTVLLPQIFSMEQLGYKDSELAIPAIGPLLRFLRRYPPDLVELETPATGAWLVMLCCKVLGIRVISHYRTDVMGYVRLLVRNRPMIAYIRMWMWLFSHLTKPVVAPSKDFVAALQKDMRLRQQDIRLLPRGLRTGQYNPQLRSGPLWNSLSSLKNRVRFLFVGRISKEKALHFLADTWKQFRVLRPESELLIVGAGPYLEELREELRECPEVLLPGQRGLDDLAQLYAQADWFVFPSGTDTFGNVVVESLASGSPALVSDRGGPRDIVEEGACGEVIPFEDTAAWVDALVRAHDTARDPQAYELLRGRAYERSKHYCLETACAAQWAFYQSLFPK